MDTIAKKQLLTTQVQTNGSTNVLKKRNTAFVAKESNANYVFAIENNLMQVSIKGRNWSFMQKYETVRNLSSIQY